jgi:AraC-like DNA-binding protein
MSAMPTRSEPASPTLAAVLLPGERSRVEAAGTGHFAIVHRDNVFDAIRVVRERSVDALVLSVHQCGPDHVEEIAQFVRRFPSVPTVAFVSHHDARATEMLLRLGASGVRQVVDVTGPAGWTRLRQLVSEPVTRSAARIQGPLLAALEDLPPDARLFLEVLVRLAPDTATVRQLAARLRIRPSTLMSRFARAGLPSPKSYLAAMRLLHASQMLEDAGLSIADVAHRLDYSSPQSFGRHVRSLLGITSSEFRKRFPFPLALRRFIELMIRPYAHVWARFHPLERSGPSMSSPGDTDRRVSPR